MNTKPQSTNFSDELSLLDRNYDVADTYANNLAEYRKMHPPQAFRFTRFLQNHIEPKRRRVAGFTALSLGVLGIMALLILQAKKRAK